MRAGIGRVACTAPRSAWPSSWRCLSEKCDGDLKDPSWRIPRARQEMLFWNECSRFRGEKKKFLSPGRCLSTSEREKTVDSTFALSSPSLSFLFLLLLERLFQKSLCSRAPSDVGSSGAVCRGAWSCWSCWCCCCEHQAVDVVDFVDSTGDGDASSSSCLATSREVDSKVGSGCCLHG